MLVWHPSGILLLVLDRFLLAEDREELFPRFSLDIDRLSHLFDRFRRRLKAVYIDRIGFL
jgi:hypothetical protein